MNYCGKHWKVITEAFGHTDIEDLNERLSVLVSEFGSDPYLDTTALSMTAIGTVVDMSKYDNSLFNLQTVIDNQGGCVICFTGDEYLKLCIDRVKDNNREKIKNDN